MKTWLTDFFIFSNREHKGSISLLLLIGIFLLLPQLLRHSSAPKEAVDKELLVEAFRQYKEQPRDEPTKTLFRFNPNTASRQDLLQLGLSEKTANLLLNYRKKKGVFRTAADFKKIYTLPLATFERLEPYLSFEPIASNANKPSERYDTLNYKKFPFDPNTISLDSLRLLGLLKNEISHLDNLRKKGIRFIKKEQFKVSSWRPEKMLELQGLAHFPTTATTNVMPGKTPNDTTKTMRVNNSEERYDLNLATVDQLLRISGIGNYYAKTIVEKRSMLGSFVKLDQLADLMPDSLYRKVLPRLTLSPKPVKRLDINTVDLPLLQQYPGLKYKAAIIINYRNNHGAFHSLHDLWKVEGIRKDILDKLAPYLDFGS